MEFENECNAKWKVVFVNSVEVLFYSRQLPLDSGPSSLENPEINDLLQGNFLLSDAWAFFNTRS